MLCPPRPVSSVKVTFAVDVSKPTTIRVNMPVPTTRQITVGPACRKYAKITPTPTDTTVRLMFSVIPVAIPSTGMPVSKPTGPRLKPTNPSISNIPRCVPHAASAKNVTVFYAASKRSEPIDAGSGNADAVTSRSMYINIDVSYKSKRPRPRYNGNKDVDSQIVRLLQADCSPSWTTVPPAYTRY